MLSSMAREKAKVNLNFYCDVKEKFVFSLLALMLSNFPKKNKKKKT